MKKNLTDEEILKTADALNWEKGFDKMRIIDIARALRVSHTAIYKHFENKEVIFEKLLRERYDVPLRMKRLKGNASQKSCDFVLQLHAVNVQAYEKNPEHFESCARYFRSNLAMHTRYLHIVAELMVREIGISEQIAFDLLSLLQQFHSPLFLELWVEPTFEADFKRTWKLLKKGIKESLK